MEYTPARTSIRRRSTSTILRGADTLVHEPPFAGGTDRGLEKTGVISMPVRVSGQRVR